VTKIHRVLAAVDFSESARAAFDRALAISRLHGAELIVVHAVPTDRPFGWHARERIALIESLRHAAGAAGVRFTASVQHGDPAGVILLHAGSRKPDLIVLGSNKRSGFERFRFGSVAETVAREAAPPVLVVPAEAGAVAASEPPFRNILVAIDFSDGSGDAIARALAMANGESRVTVMHALNGVPFELAHRYAYHLMEPEYQRSLARAARRRLAALIPSGTAAAGRVHTRVVTGDTAAAISRVAADIGADLILVGVTARGAIGRLVMGSTAARVMRTAGRPVLAIPQLAGEAAAPIPAGDHLAAAA
jgi:nucleotide-binding universal stress UspA family protein